MGFIDLFVRRFSMLVMLAAGPAVYAMTPDPPQQSSFCSMLDPLAAYPIKHCMNEVPGGTLAGDPDEALFQRLMKLQSGGKFSDALEQIDEQIAHRPLSPSLYFVRGMLLQAEDRQFDAIVEFNRVLALDPGMLSALLQRGWARARMYDLQGALADTNHVLAIVPEHPAALLNKSLLLIGSGERDEGMSMLGDLISKSNQAGELLLVRAQLLLAEGETDAALSDLARITMLLPDDPRGYVLRANILIQREDPTALADLDKAIELGSPEPDLLLWRVRLKQRQGDHVGAGEDFKAYAAKNPLGAAEAWKQARVNLKPDTARVTALSMELQEKILRSDGEGAENAADELLQLTPEDTRLFVVKAMAAFQRSECDQGAAYLKKAPAEVQNSVPVLRGHAICLMNQGKSAESLTLTTRMLEIMPNEPITMRLRGTALLQSDRYEEALDAANELISQGAATPDDETLRISALNYLRRREEAGRLAIDFVRRYGSEDRQIIHVVPEIVFSLQREPTWPLAIELLGMFKPHPTQQDTVNYLVARGQMHRGQTAEALATLVHIKSTGNSLPVVDGEFRALWENPEFKTVFDPLTSGRRSFERFYHQHLAAPESLVETVAAIAHLRALGCRQQALANALRLLETAPRYPEWNGGADDAYMLVATLLIQQGDLDGAARTFDQALAKIPGLQTTELLLDYASLLVSAGQYGKAIILSDLALQRGITPFGKVIAHRIRAFAFDGLNDAKGRTEALDYLEMHWRDNLVAALDPLGMLRSYDRLLAIIGEAAQDPVRGRYLLMSLNKVTGIPAHTEIDRRIDAFLERLKSDPKVLEAVDRVGRIKPLAYQATCLLSEQELGERPFRFPFETAPVAGEADGVDERAMPVR